MKRFSALTVVLLSCWLCSGKVLAASPEVEKARQHGAQGQVTLRITDSTGRPVEKAKLSVAFWGSDSSVDAVVSEGQTDTNGLFVATGKTIHSMNYTVTKESYYKTTGQYWFLRRGETCIQNGRWQPWNPTNTVILKEKMNPVPMYAKRIAITIPVKDKPIGFDFETGDWVMPYGKGKQSDVLFTYRLEVKDFWTGTNQLIIAFSNKMDGINRSKKDMWSGFNSSYEAPADEYQSSLSLVREGTRERVKKDEKIDRSEYLIFRVRTILDKNGNIINARYGKIYGPIEYGAGHEGDHIRFIYYFNPDGTRNLEFDPKQNLFHWKHDAPENVYEP